MTALLSVLPLQSKATITRYLDEGIASRMIALGLMPDQEVQIMRVSPFGDAIYLKYGNTQIAMRMSEAEQVLVTSSLSLI